MASALRARAPRWAPAGADGRIAWIGGLSTKGLPPGTYEVVASVRQGEMTAEERATFALGGGAGAMDVANPLPAGGPPVPADVAPLLEKAARYVLEYETAFSDVVADETYTQWAAPENTPDRGLTISCALSLCRRTTRADVVFVRLGGAIPWGCFRDVYEVDGQKVREPEGRLEAIFAGGATESAAQRARRVLDESAKYNIGPAIRNVNFPTLALVFLHPANQKRFAWSRGGRRKFGSVEAVEVQFDEVARPTLVDRGGKGDLPAKGRFFVDPARGTVVRSEVTFRLEETIGARARAYVAADYQPAPRLAMWVPVEMHEEYEDLPGNATRVFGARSEGAARYAGFRRFSVTTEETGRVADEPAEAGGAEPKPDEPRP